MYSSLQRKVCMKVHNTYTANTLWVLGLLFANLWWCYFPTPAWCAIHLDFPTPAGCAIHLESCSTMCILQYSSRIHSWDVYITILHDCDIKWFMKLHTQSQESLCRSTFPISLRRLATNSQTFLCKLLYMYMYLIARCILRILVIHDIV